MKIHVFCSPGPSEWAINGVRWLKLLKRTQRSICVCAFARPSGKDGGRREEEDRKGLTQELDPDAL